MGRRVLTEDTAWDDCYQRVAYTADALTLAGADDDREVGALARKVDALLDRWETLDDERRAGRRGVGRANALVRRRDLQADAVVTDLHAEVLAQVKQKREHPLFVRLFPDTLTALVKLSLPGELPELRKLSRALSEKDTPAALRKSHARTLSDAIAQGEAALSSREDAFAAQGRTSARLAAWKEDANRVLLGVEGALKLLASERGLDADWADTFFPDADPTKKPTKKPAKKPAPTPAPA